MGQAGNAGTPLITKKIAQITSIIAQYSKIFLLQFPLAKYRLLHLELGLRVKFIISIRGREKRPIGSKNLESTLLYAICSYLTQNGVICPH